jgi:hypothetical protein
MNNDYSELNNLLESILNVLVSWFGIALVVAGINCLN